MSKQDNPNLSSDALSWIAYYRLRRPLDYSRALKDLPPTDEFMDLAEQKVIMTRSNGKTYLSNFPTSLHTSKGQRQLHNAAKRLEFLINSIPRQCVAKLEVFESLPIKRKDNKDNLRMITTSILHRAAIEKKTEVIFAYNSLILHIEKSFNKTFFPRQIKPMLEQLDGTFFKVIYGEQNYRGMATKIETLLDPAELSSQSAADIFLDKYAHAMDKVYLREEKASNARKLQQQDYALKTTSGASND